MTKSKFPLHWQILIAIVLAVLYGIFLPQKVGLVSWMGDLFLRLLKMVIVPLVLSSIVSGVANIDVAQNLGRIALKTIALYLLTGFLAIFTGLLLVNTIKPGVGLDIGFSQNVENLNVGKTSVSELVLRIVPTNIFEAFVKSDMLQIIFFAILFGVFITRSNNHYSDFLKNFFNSSFEVMMKITEFIMKFTAFGVFGIVARVVAEQKDIVQIAEKLGLYVLVVVLGLALHMFVTLPGLLFVFRINGYSFFRKMSTALLTAFSTSSSSATLPVTLDCVQNKAGISNKIASFTLPLGATINMNGTALYELVVAMFIAQVYGIQLNFVQQMIVVLTALLASIGAAGIPMAGLVMISIVLTAVGLPLEGIGLILAVDRVLDMFRTSVNVWSDTCCAAIVAKTEGENI